MASKFVVGPCCGMFRIQSRYHVNMINDGSPFPDLRHSKKALLSAWSIIKQQSNTMEKVDVLSALAGKVEFLEAGADHGAKDNECLKIKGLYEAVYNKLISME